MIRIDITPVVMVQKTHTSKGKTTTRQVREYSAIARRGEDILAEVTATEGYSVIPPILNKVKEAGADLGEEIMFYRGDTPVFVTMTLDHWLNPPKKPKKPKKAKMTKGKNDEREDNSVGEEGGE
ncbi:MAG: hypothetical protein QM805_07830 [Pseudomonas sp.]